MRPPPKSWSMKRFARWPIDAGQPQRPAQAAGTRRGPGHRDPTAIDFVRLVGIDKNVAVAIVRSGARDRYLLMPAMLAADRIRLHRESEILVHAGVVPPDPLGVGVGARERLDAPPLTHQPSPGLDLVQIDQRRRPSLAAAIRLESPASEMMRACEHARPDALGHPCLVDEIANLGSHSQQIAGRDTEPPRILGVQPQWITM